MTKAKITKKSLTEELKAHGFILSPCITSCNAGDLRVYRESGKGYYATINFVGGKLKFNDQTYDSVDAMLEAIEEYNKTLEFSPDTYNPDYDMNCVADLRSIETLDKCGYNMNGYGYNGEMKFTTEGVLGVKFPVVNGNYLNRKLYGNRNKTVPFPLYRKQPTMKDIDKLIQEAIEFGVKKWGSRQVMAIEIASHWLEGYMKAVTFTEEESAEIRERLDNYRFHEQ